MGRAEDTGEWLEREVIDNSDSRIDYWQSAKCSVCGRYHTTPYMYFFDEYPYCPMCGAKMEEEIESEGTHDKGRSTNQKA